MEVTTTKEQPCIKMCLQVRACMSAGARVFSKFSTFVVQQAFHASCMLSEGPCQQARSSRCPMLAIEHTRYSNAVPVCCFLALFGSPSLCWTSEEGRDEFLCMWLLFYAQPKNSKCQGSISFCTKTKATFQTTGAKVIRIPRNKLRNHNSPDVSG